MSIGYSFGFRDEKGYLRRIIFLETVAGVPGMVGAMMRHLSSLRKMEQDFGWIHTLLEGKVYLGSYQYTGASSNHSVALSSDQKLKMNACI